MSGLIYSSHNNYCSFAKKKHDKACNLQNAAYENHAFFSQDNVIMLD